MSARRVRNTDITPTWKQQAPMAFPAPAVPLTCLSISIAVYARGLVATRHKWLSLVSLLFFQYFALATSNHWPNNGIDSLWGLTICIWISHSLSILFLEDQNLLANLDLHSRNRPWYWEGWKTWNNIRLLGTRRVECYTPQSFYGSQSRSLFAMIRMSKLVVYWVLTNFIQPLIMPGTFVPFHPSDFDEIRQTFFRRIFSEHDPITTRETMLRATFAIFWAWAAYTMLDAAHSALSILFVVIFRVDAPHQWPPIFGDLREASSLRGFWGSSGIVSSCCLTATTAFVSLRMFLECDRVPGFISSLSLSLFS